MKNTPIDLGVRGSSLEARDTMLKALARRRQAGAGAAAPVIALCHALVSERGEVEGSRLAAQTLAAYSALSDEAREEFFDLLARQFSPDPARVWAAAQRHHEEPTAPNLLALQVAVEPPRQELFRRLNMAPRGITTLLDLRRRLLSTLPAHPERATVDADLLHLFRSWFNRGFLILQRIDWDTPATTLERLIEYEAVHQIQGWSDLRRRLQADRRCYGFFHPAVPGDPLIFIEVALTRGLPETVQELIDPSSPVGDPHRANHAVFYSITSCHDGLRGVSFGNFLIKQVADDLGREFRNLRIFSTLSPIPNFRAWLSEQKSAGRTLPPAISDLVATPSTTPVDVPATLREDLLALGAEYLLHAKRSDHAPLDPVARFHLANGARLEHINWRGDRSATGLRRSFGLTANYVYRLRELEQNHDAFAREFRVVATPRLTRMAARLRPR